MFVEFQSPGVSQATKRLVHAVQQDNVQYLLIGEMLLEASASHLADAVVGGDVVDRPQQGSIRIAPITVARPSLKSGWKEPADTFSVVCKGSPFS